MESSDPRCHELCQPEEPKKILDDEDSTRYPTNELRLHLVWSLECRLGVTGHTNLRSHLGNGRLAFFLSRRLGSQDGCYTFVRETNICPDWEWSDGDCL